jgi:hypothetical protein
MVSTRSANLPSPLFIARYLIDLDQELESRSLLHSVLAEAWHMPDCSAGRALPSCSAASAFEPQISRLWDVIAPMNSSKVYEVIAGIAMIITGLFLGYDELWGALMILLGVLFLILWLASGVDALAA